MITGLIRAASRRRLLRTALLALPAIGLLWGFWALVSWNGKNDGFNVYRNWAVQPGWEYRLGDLPRHAGELPPNDADAPWLPVGDRMPAEAIPDEYEGYYWLRATLPVSFREDGLHLFVRGFKAVQLFTPSREVYAFNMDPRDFKVNKLLHWGLAPLEPADFGGTVWVRAYADGTAPSVGDLLLGKPEAFYLDMLRQDAFRIALSVLFLFFSVCSFLLFAVHAKESIYFHFAVLTACAAYGSVVRAPAFQLFADIPLFVYLQDVVFAAGAAALIGFLSRLYDGGTRKLFRAFMASGWAFAAIVCYVALRDEPLYHFLIDKVFIGVLCVFLSIMLSLMIRSYRRAKDRETPWVFAGMLLLLGFAIAHYVQVDVYSIAALTYKAFPYLTVYLNGTMLTAGVFLFVICLGAVLILRFDDTLLQIRRYAVELAGKNRQLEEMDRLKDDFLARTSHELRTPLFGIVGLAEALQESMSAGDEERRRLSLMIASARRLTRLVNDILDLSKLRHGDLRIAARPVDVRKTAEGVAALLQPQAEAKGLVIRCAIASDLPLVSADEDRVEQILFNLVGNSVKFSAGGDVTIAERPADGENGFVHIAVSDSGPGIPEEDLASIFEEFRQSRHSSEQGVGGTGLGLTISKQLAELQGGKLAVESRLGVGSTFTLSLPVWGGNAATGEPAVMRNDVPPIAAAGKAAETPSIPPLPGQGADGPPSERTILVVDDEPTNLEVLASYLSPLYRVVLRSHPEQALAALADGLKPDLVITDVMMPGMSGYELNRRIRRMYGEAELPILMLTAKSLPEDLAEGFRSGANDYVTKPVARQELLARAALHLKVTELNRSLEGKVRERTDELERRNRELQFSVEETMEALREIVALEERNRIAHEIHDSVGHTMTAAIMQLEATKRLLPVDRELALEKLSAGQGLIRDSLDQIRSAVRMLRDDVAKTDTLESLASLIRETERLTGVTVSYRIDPLPQLPPIYRKVIFHALQEGLTNGLKHGGCSKFEFALAAEEGRLTFALRNDGARYDAAPFGFGLTAMRERILRLGGTLRVQDAPGWGCELCITLPIARGEDSWS